MLCGDVTAVWWTVLVIQVAYNSDTMLCGDVTSGSLYLRHNIAGGAGGGGGRGRH